MLNDANGWFIRLSGRAPGALPRKSPMNHSLTLYHFLCRVTWPKSYIGKMLLIAFLGVHIPLLSLISYTAIVTIHWTTALSVIVVSVIATVLGSLITLFVQAQALAPILQATTALNRYITTGELPTLPTTFADEAGQLMANTQECITHLDRLLQLKQNLLAILSHDIRNPITSVTLATDLMSKELTRPTIDTARLQRHLLKIRAASQQQMALMNNTLVLVQSEAGKLATQISEVNLQKLGNEILAETQLQAEHKGLTYTLQVTSTPEQTVGLDVAKTKQLVTNLVTNAIKFTPSGGTIALTADYQNGIVIFRVRDSGLGMDAATRAALFQPFSNAQRTGTAKEAGTGLGLWICKTFVDAQDGQISVESEPGAGSCFIVNLPDQQAALPNHTGRPVEQPNSGSRLDVHQQQLAPV